MAVIAAVSVSQYNSLDMIFSPAVLGLRLRRTVRAPVRSRIAWQPGRLVRMPETTHKRLREGQKAGSPRSSERGILSAPGRPAFFERGLYMKKLCLIASVAVFASLAAAPAKADVVVVRWNSGACQIWDNAAGPPPWPQGEF